MVQNEFVIPWMFYGEFKVINLMVSSVKEDGTSHMCRSWKSTS